MNNSSSKPVGSVQNQLAEYRKRQADRFKNLDDSSENESNMQSMTRGPDTSRQQNYTSEPDAKFEKKEFQSVHRAPREEESAFDEPNNNNMNFLSDFELAKQLQEEENRRYSENFENNSNSINYSPDRHNDNRYQPPMLEDGVRPADNYRQEQLIPDANDEEMRRQEFLRQQQILYSHYQNQRQGNGNANGGDLEQGFLPGNRRSINHVHMPVFGRVNRELCNCILLGFLFSILLTIMILILVLK